MVWDNTKLKNKYNHIEWNKEIIHQTGTSSHRKILLHNKRTLKDNVYTYWALFRTATESIGG
jgi:hypothetical protein